VRAPVPRSVWQLCVASPHTVDLFDYLAERHVLHRLQSTKRDRNDSFGLFGEELWPIGTAADQPSKTPQSMPATKELANFYQKLKNQGLNGDDMEQRFVAFRNVLVKMRKLKLRWVQIHVSMLGRCVPQSQ
jgi:hypothetical protein